VSDDVWQDVRPGDLIALPNGGSGLVMVVRLGDAPCPSNAVVIVLTVTGQIEPFTKAVLADEPVLERPASAQTEDLVAALKKLPANPDPENVSMIFNSVERPLTEPGWSRLARLLACLPTFGK
jgi:hypothetical protein